MEEIERLNEFGVHACACKKSIMTKENDNAIAKIFEGYKGGDEMPLAGYATLFGVYNIAILVMLLSEKPRKEKWLDDINLTDILLLGVATYKISRVISSDRVTSPLRAPFMEYIEPDGASEVKEKVRGKGLQRAVGDLLHCPFCLGSWVSAALGTGLIVRPKTTRFVSKIFAVVALADVLQQAYGMLKEKEK